MTITQLRIDLELVAKRKATADFFNDIHSSMLNQHLIYKINNDRRISTKRMNLITEEAQKVQLDYLNKYYIEASHYDHTT